MIRNISVPHGTLVADIRGQGTPIVFLHGFSLDRSMWAPQVDVFSDRCNCIAYDLRGFGDSSLPDGDYDHMADLLAVLDALELGPVHLVGLSLGANVALALAWHHPERLRSLTLVSSGLIGHDWGAQERPPSAADRVAREQGAEAARAFWLAHPLFASLNRHPDAQQSVHLQVQRFSGWHWGAEGRGARISAVRALDEIVVPTLVVSGDLDVAGYRDIAAHLAASIPNAQLYRCADAGHMCTLETPEAFNSALQTFFKQTEGTPL